ncbi:MAG TPA: PLP-dependent aminotransferase family protein [Candidatus Faeciplasma avium]|uniref:PLP-dependent aminotransferase family protein n=1 Tax=Candidatus Faeciplasma avium TaxID=2840798 RepID=A0A9D1NPF3_9FIRM|nr:PLP-dependent aminotransferase family protein [Candidatus Faeciplasma avium]
MNYNFSEKLRVMKPSAIREIFKSLGTPGSISFAAGNPSPESFPISDIKRLADDILTNQPVTALQYGVTEGYTELRELVSRRLKTVYGIGSCDDDTIIVTGGQQGIELTCKVFCSEGDIVVCENPSFIGALNAFRSLGARLMGVPLCENGIDTAALEKILSENERVKLLYTIPSFQNPSGITSTLENRRAVYELARRYDIIIIEDNPYGDLRFTGEDVPTYKSFDSDGRVVYCGSFSKILSAGIRIGTLTANKEIVSKIVVAKQVEDVHTNVFFQMVTAKFIKECDLDKHILKIRELYRHKATVMLEALDRYMPKDVSYTRPEGGIFLWCTLPEGIRLSDFVSLAAEKNVFVVPGTAFLPDESEPTRSFRLNYSMPSDSEIDKGIRLLAETVSELR